jgi:signal transduction histidine kinase
MACDMRRTLLPPGAGDLPPNEESESACGGRSAGAGSVCRGRSGWRAGVSVRFMSVALRQRLWDLGVPLLILAAGVFDLYTPACISCEAPAEHWHHLGSRAENMAFLLAVCAPLVWRRRHPVAVCVVFLVVQLAWHIELYSTVDWSPGSGAPLAAPFIAGAVAFFWLGRRGKLALSEAVALLFFCYLLTQVALFGRVGAVAGSAGMELICLVALLIGRALGRREQDIGVLRDRAAQLERERELEAERAVLEERARIARELHDVIAHAVSVIVVQASAERRLLGPEQDSTLDTLDTIERAGREALTELRGLLGVLRAPADADRLTPQPGLEALHTLLEEVRSAGQTVSVNVEGEPVALPAGVDLAAYRIVQEALTNARRHAAGSHAAVTLRWRRGELGIEVVDDGPGPAQAGDPPGHGLIGLRERAALYGGGVETGAAGPEGGFRLRARLPIEAPGA